MLPPRASTSTSLHQCGSWCGEGQCSAESHIFFLLDLKDFHWSNPQNERLLWLSVLKDTSAPTPKQRQSLFASSYLFWENKGSVNFKNKSKVTMKKNSSPQTRTMQCSVPCPHTEGLDSIVFAVNMFSLCGIERESKYCMRNESHWS